MRKYGDSKAVVIISTAVDCQENIERLPKYRLLRTTWERQGVTFLAINSTARYSRADIRHMDDLYNFDLPILLDSSQLVAESLGLTRAGEIIVLAPDRFQVLYRGGLDIESRPARPERGVEGREGTSFLADTLQAVVAGATSFGETVTVAGEGCELGFSALAQHADRTPDYATEIAPLLQEKCVSCHVEGGIAPFAMNSHMMVQGWSPMMKEVVMTKRMPPAQVDPAVNHFDNARYMDAGELQTLTHWIRSEERPVGKECRSRWSPSP